MHIIFNKGATKIVKRKYGLISSGTSWHSPQFENMKYELLRDHLIRHDIYNESKVKLLIEVLTKEIERRKNPTFLVPGIFISLSVPVWNQFITYTYKSVNTDKAAIDVLITMTAIIGIIIIMTTSIRWVSAELKDTITLNPVNLRKTLIKKLENILLEIPSSK